jgi:hypothetical protein
MEVISHPRYILIILLLYMPDEKLGKSKRFFAGWRMTTFSVILRPKAKGSPILKIKEVGDSSLTLRMTLFGRSSSFRGLWSEGFHFKFHENS